MVPLGEKIHTAFGCNMDVRTRMLRKQHDIQHRDYKCAHPHARTCTRGDSAQGTGPWALHAERLAAIWCIHHGRRTISNAWCTAWQLRVDRMDGA